MSAFTYSIKTMGCKANLYDSFLLEKDLVDLGGTRDDKSPDIYVLNSCTVTNEADKQSHREVNLIKKRSPQSLTIITGCYAEVGKNELKKNENISLIVGNQQKGNLKNIVADHFKLRVDAQSKNSNEIFWGKLPQHFGKTRAFIKIQEGCNDFCTYCIIPYARGVSRSVRMGHVLEEIQRLSQTGIKEIVLTGTNIADYGKDLDQSLEDLIEAILKHTDIARLRLSSLDPSEISEKMLNLMASHKRLMPHFHISLQSVVSRILRAMKRQYRQQDVIDCLTEIYHMNPDIYVGMDIITGFPSETDQEHQETLKLLADLPWTKLHVFPYSERKNTPATKIRNAVALEIRKKRAQDLLKLSFKKQKIFMSRFIEKTIPDVLFETYHEKEGKSYAIGHAPNYVHVMAEMPKSASQKSCTIAKNEIYPATSLDSGAIVNQIRSVQAIDLVAKSSQDWTLLGVLHA